MNIIITQNKATEVKVDLLALGYFSDTEKLEGPLEEVNQGLDASILDMIQQKEITGKYKETTLIRTFGKIPAKKIVIIGLGERKDFDQDKIREVTGIVVKTALKENAKTVASVLFGLHHQSIHEHHVTHSFAEGAHLAGYKFVGYVSEKKEVEKIESIEILSDTINDELLFGIECGSAYGEGTNLARDLTNTPGNLMTPTILAEKAVEIARKYGMEYQVLEREEMKRLGMGGLLAVSQGGEQPPKMIVIKYHGQDIWENVLAFVGKGLTFDSGGISLKPRENMDKMKTDMGGGAAVLGAMEAIGRLKPAINILAVVPASENMPSGSAYKPGDVLTTFSGKTVEVLNTDAEGRLILADGITYAKRLGANKIIDVATLTGAVVIALGNVATGVLTNNDSFLATFNKSAKKAGEKVWQLPAFDEYKEQIKSDIADLKNTGGRPAGSITAGLFLSAFAEETPWLHLDIAGTSWTDKGSELNPKGATGAMVRSLVQIAKHYGKHGMDN